MGKTLKNPTAVAVPCSCATSPTTCPIHGDNPTAHDTYAEHCRERQPGSPAHSGGRCPLCDLLHPERPGSDTAAGGDRTSHVQARLAIAEAALRYIASPTMGLPPGLDAHEHAGKTPESMAQDALQRCISQARDALRKIDGEPGLSVDVAQRHRDAPADTGDAYTAFRGWVLSCLWCDFECRSDTKTSALKKMQDHYDRVIPEGADIR